jgi:hypothetical protein
MLVNSTVSENANGVYGWETTLINSTVLANAAPGGDAIGAGDVYIRNSLVAGGCVDSYIGAGVTSYGYNIEAADDTCGFDQPTDQVNVSADDLNLRPLQDNGGPSETHALGEGSIAIDVIPEADCVDADGQPLTTDQRGFPRDSMCDVGAFEVQP